MNHIAFDDPHEAVLFIREKKFEVIDLKVIDLVGRLHHLSIPASNISNDLFMRGFGFDGSSYQGYKSVEAGDMVMLPDHTTAVIDPFWERSTISFFCNIVEADRTTAFGRDPRAVCRRAEEYLESLGAGKYIISPEYEFYLFDDVRFTNDAKISQFVVNGGDMNGLDDSYYPPSHDPYHMLPHDGYHAVPPQDRYCDIRNRISQAIEVSGIEVKYHHHEVGGSSQHEIELGFETLLHAADHNIWIKYLIRNIAYQSGLFATLMPKPLYGEPGNGMHVHQFLQRDGKSTFYSSDENAYGNLSDVGRNFVGGLLAHGRALSALTNPSANSYCRLVPGYEAPVSLFYSLGNRTSAIRIPKYARNPEKMRIEYRPPDATANPYLAFAAMLMAGIDGIINRIEPPDPIDKDITTMAPQELEDIVVLPGGLGQALQCLENDHEFLLSGDVFSEDLIYAFIDLKRKDVAEAGRRPTPLDYQLYFDL